MKKHLLAAAVLSTLAAPTVTLAADAPASPHTLTGNVGIYSQYIFRGLTQTAEKPALQGGFDYSHASGFYAGTWASSISWLKDFGAYTTSQLEWDFYGGYKGSFGKSDFTYDVGFLYYYYPGSVAPGFTNADTKEIYGALGWKWLSAKYSYSVDDTFGVPNSDGSWYLDLGASVPLGDTGLSLLAHWGKQKYKGTTLGVSNNVASYEDWKLGLSYALPKDFTIGAYYTDTNANRPFYTDPNGTFLGDSQFTVYLQKTF